MRCLLAIAFAIATTSAHAGETVATRVVDAPTPGQVLILELSDNPPEPGVCKKGTYMARIMLDNPTYANRSSRINLGCWHYASDGRNGRVVYSGWDQVLKKPINMNLGADVFSPTHAFTAWEDYAGN